MMKRRYITIPVLAVSIFAGCIRSPEPVRPWQTAVAELDRTLSKGDEIAVMGQNLREAVHSRLAAAGNPSSGFEACDELFGHFFALNLDSALFYAHLGDSLAVLSGNKRYMNKAKYNLAERYLTSGLYNEALNVLQDVDLAQTDTDGKVALYYQVFHSIYHGLALTSKDEWLSKHYRSIEKRYQALSQTAMTSDMLDYYTVHAGIMIEEGRAPEARCMLEAYLENGSHSAPDLAILHYWIAKTYKAEDRTDDALEHFATSARFDFLTPVNSSRALVNTARLLWQKGDIDRAYAYITRAYDGATEADGKLCLGEISEIMPDITDEYMAKESRRLFRLRASITLLIALSLTIAAVLLVMGFFQKRIRSINASLEDSVARLKKANEMKEICLGRYLSLFSNEISSLERYRSSLRITAKSHDINDIIQALKSDDFIDGEREILYREFDATFLAAFPDFVEQVNALLQPDKRIGGRLKEGRLNNELRIFALIRLGVQDSTMIARFLKKAPSTIYNYRVKLRSAAVCGYDEFESRLMAIGAD